MDNPRIEILMATYNGGAFLREQLDSLCRQTYPHWRLTIHDDGSRDDTLAIINDYRKKDGRINLLDDTVSGLGAAKNYLHLMSRVDGAFYMFCDQDDIWHDDKIAKMLQVIRDYDGPAAVYSNSSLYVDGKDIPQQSTVIHPSAVRNTLFFNSGIQGCAIIMNHHLMKLLRPFPDVVAMHDHLVTLGAVSLGKMVYLDESLMRYRQHNLNVTGNQSFSGWQRIRAFFASGKPVIDNPHFEAVEAFYNRYGQLMDAPTQSLYQAYFRYARSPSVFERLFILLNNRFTLGNKRGVLFLKTMIRKPLG